MVRSFQLAVFSRQTFVIATAEKAKRPKAREQLYYLPFVIEQTTLCFFLRACPSPFLSLFLLSTFSINLLFFFLSFVLLTSISVMAETPTQSQPAAAQPAALATPQEAQTQSIADVITTFRPLRVKLTNNIYPQEVMIYTHCQH